MSYQPDWPEELLHCPILPKPFSLDALVKLVGVVLAQADTTPEIREGNGG